MILILNRENALLLRVYYDSKVVTKHEQVLEFNREDLFCESFKYAYQKIKLTKMTKHKGSLVSIPPILSIEQAFQ